MDRAGGVLLVDKPVGLTSFGVVERIRRWSGIRRVGHTGTLDPFATGLLVLCLGMATRLVSYITAWDKEYEGSIRLGEETDTDDATGRVTVRKEPGNLDAQELEEALKAFRGEIQQLPPRFSAKKLSGVPSYKRARRGEEVELRPIGVQVHELEITGIEMPLVHFRARCSKGTYMRSLARDLGRALGCGGHLASLRRVAIGHIKVQEALGWEEVRSLRGEALLARLWPMERVLSGWNKLVVAPELARRVRHGQDLPLESLGGSIQDLSRPGERVVLVDELGELLGVGVVMGEGPNMRIHPEQVWSGG
ncbi:MAG: tRNA pseudouridine(55) synthase TruB [Thermodesulfobacteriota bacterium]